MRFGEVDLGDPPVGQETMHLPLYLCFTLWHRGRSVAKQSHSFVIPDPVSESARRESHVPVVESSVAPGSMQTSPRDLTRNQGELVRSSLENADPATVRRRIVGKRTIIPPLPSASSANVDSRSVPDSFPEAGMPKALEPCAGDSKKRRVESSDESVDWFQRERSSIAWLTNSSDERKVFEIDVGDHLERVSDGKSTEVTCRRLLPGQQLQFDDAMTKELSQVMAADAVRRLSQEEELNLKPEKWLRMRWVLTWKYTEGGDRKAKARLVILVYQHPELTSVPTTAPTLGKMSRHLLLQACALHKLRIHLGDGSSAFL